MFTRDRFQTDPVRKSNGIGLLFTRDRFATGPEPDPKLDLLFRKSNFGSVWIRSGPVPERSRLNRSRSGPVRFGTVPVKSRVNVALNH